MNEAYPCTFTGSAQTVHITGQGAAVLLEEGFFWHGGIANVELLGASIGKALPNLTIERPAGKNIVLVNMNGEKDPYDAEYSAGPPLVITIHKGGADGSIPRTLSLHCPPGKDDCDVLWGQGKKTITVERTEPTQAPLAGQFPHPPRTAGEYVERIELRDAAGDLSCEGHGTVRVRDVSQIWLKGDHESLGIDAITVAPEGLKVSVTNEAPPKRTEVTSSPSPIPASAAPSASAPTAGVEPTGSAPTPDPGFPLFTLVLIATPLLLAFVLLAAFLRFRVQPRASRTSRPATSPTATSPDTAPSAANPTGATSSLPAQPTDAAALSTPAHPRTASADSPSASNSPLQRPLLRELVDKLVRSDSDLNAFCSDYFPDVYRRFAIGMNRLDKVTLLLDHTDATQMLEALRRKYPKAAPEIARLLKPTA